MKKVELLAPAGNYESFVAAINAGADAVYMAGNKFGARAYADNFTEEEVCSAIKYAHLFGRKVYLTVNILLKEQELATLYDYLDPFYRAGLDGVIVQDIGAFYDMKAHFPELELHGSTQMTLTGINGAKLLKKMGASRIVPARELSLQEIRDIKENVDIEIEAFVHGAECYSYSGACLFSSILGGRSGNRGRCAQPCRLPYDAICNHKKVTNGEQYLLSLKDMCTLQLIPELIEAGIDSFKIEGRMKKPEYAAGVTAIYRKYIDLYYQNPSDFKVSNKDLECIKKLYIRSEIQDGYYKKHNGKEMVTLTKPSYSGSDEDLLEKIRNKYINIRKKLSISGCIKLHCNEELTCMVTEQITQKSVTVSGNRVEKASNRPVLMADVKKQMNKTGHTNFIFSDLTIDMEDDIFIPLKAINEVRRLALEQLERKLLGEERESISDITAIPVNLCLHHKGADKQVALNEIAPVALNDMQTYEKVSNRNIMQIVVNSMEQFDTVLKYSEAAEIVVSSDLLFTEHSVEEAFQNIKANIQHADKKLLFALPFIVRKRSYEYLDKVWPILQESCVEGVMVRNLETLNWLHEKQFAKKIITDAEVYCFNHITKKYLLQQADEVTVSYEMNLKELLQLGLENMTIPVYGRIPMMITANCVRKTAMKCLNNSKECNQNPLMLEDRYHKNFYVHTNCTHCYNVIYNGQPSSLHSYINQFISHNVKHLRIDFTTEGSEDVKNIISYFEQIIKTPLQKSNPPYKEFTKGHLGRGVE